MIGREWQQPQPQPLPFSVETAIEAMAASRPYILLSDFPYVYTAKGANGETEERNENFTVAVTKFDEITPAIAGQIISFLDVEAKAPSAPASGEERKFRIEIDVFADNSARGEALGIIGGQVVYKDNTIFISVSEKNRGRQYPGVTYVPGIVEESILRLMRAAIFPAWFSGKVRTSLGERTYKNLQRRINEEQAKSDFQGVRLVITENDISFDGGLRWSIKIEIPSEN